MREGLLFPGVVLLVLMVIFSFVPLPNSPSSTVSQDYPLVVQPPAFPYSEDTPVTVQWSGGLTANTWIQVVPCPSGSCANVKPTSAQLPLLYPIQVPGTTAIGNGTAGSLTIWVTTTTSFLLLTNSTSALTVTVTWNEMPEFGFLWEILTVIGILLTIGGMVLPEKGAPRGHHRRLSYHQWRHHSFALPPHLPVRGLACPACGLTDIPTEEDLCPRCQAPLPRGSAVVQGPPSSAAPAPARPGRPRPAEAAAAPASVTYAGAAAASSAPSTPAATAPDAAAAPATPPKKRTAVDRTKVAGHSLSVADADPLRPWRVMKGLGFTPQDALVFTREDPEVLQGRYALEPSQIYSVSRSEGEHTISPSESDRIADLADQHFMAHPGGVVILTDPNYFVTHGGFDMLRRLVLAIQDHARERKGTFILGFNPEVFSQDQRAQLEERMRKVV